MSATPKPEAFDLAGWARRVTKKVAAAMPTGTAALSEGQRVLFYAAAAGLRTLSRDHADPARRLDGAVHALSALEYDIEQSCLRFCARQGCTPVIPLLVLIQIMCNIRDGYAADMATWVPYVSARLQGLRSVSSMIDLAEEMHADMLRKMPREPPG